MKIIGVLLCCVFTYNYVNAGPDTTINIILDANEALVFTSTIRDQVTITIDNEGVISFNGQVWESSLPPAEMTEAQAAIYRHVPYYVKLVKQGIEDIDAAKLCIELENKFIQDIAGCVESVSSDSGLVAIYKELCEKQPYSLVVKSLSYDSQYDDHGALCAFYSNEVFVIITKNSLTDTNQNSTSARLARANRIIEEIVDFFEDNTENTRIAGIYRSGVSYDTAKADRFAERLNEVLQRQIAENESAKGRVPCDSY